MAFATSANQLSFQHCLAQQPKNWNALDGFPLLLVLYVDDFKFLDSISCWGNLSPMKTFNWKHSPFSK